MCSTPIEHVTSFLEMGADDLSSDWVVSAPTEYTRFWLAVSDVIGQDAWNGGLIGSHLCPSIR